MMLFDSMEELMKTIKSIIILTMVTMFTTTTYAAEVPREAAPCNASNEAIVFVESCIGDILTEVHNSLDMLMQERNQIAYSSILFLKDRQMFIAMASLSI